jgi:DNA-binding HxlR family transcriptional regulator
MLSKNILPADSFEMTVSIIGNKWKLLIIHNLFTHPWRFNELQQELDGISHKVLTECLTSLGEAGIITRTVYPEVPLREEYSISELGLSLKPILDSMEAWGNEYRHIANDQAM